MNRRQLIKASFLAVLGVALAPVAKLLPPSRMFQGWWCPYLPLMVSKSPVVVDVFIMLPPVVKEMDVQITLVDSRVDFGNITEGTQCNT